jgi:HlyD family secretion protein
MKKIRLVLFYFLPAVLILIAVSVIMTRASRSRHEFISGMVETKHVDVSSKIPGRVSTLLVREGDYVKKGDTLAQLESKEMAAKVEQARGAMRAAEAKSHLAMNGARPQEKKAAYNLYLQAKAQFDILDKTRTRLQKLFSDSVISVQEHDQIEAQFIAAREQMDAAKERSDMAEEGARYEDRDAAKSVFYQAQNAYNEAIAYMEELSLTSPLNGEVEKIVTDPGEVIGSGYPIITLIDTSDMWVILQIKENEMGKVRKGAVFTGTVPALDNVQQKFSVTYISPMADFATWRPTNQKGDFDVRTFEIHLRPVGTLPALRAGMTVNFQM